MSTIQPEALRLADEYAEASFDQGLHKRTLDDAPENARSALEAELRRLHQSEREGWRHASELEQERKRQHAALAHAERYAEQMGRELSKATAEIADLRARLVAIGAGGVSPLMGAAGDAGRQATIALEMLVAVGLVTQAKVDEAMSHAARITPPSSDKGVAHG